MNVLIPLCGKGSRFISYNKPKPLINILGKPMIRKVLDNLNCKSEDKIFIFYSHNLDKHSFGICLSDYDNVFLICINQETGGAAETLLLGIDSMIKDYNFHEKSLVIDCDTFYTADIVDIFRFNYSNTIFYTKQTDDRNIYSYIELEKSVINGRSVDKVIDIKEKKRISDNANTGAYGFVSILELRKYCQYIIDNAIKSQGEYYTSCVIQEMLKNHDFLGCELSKSNVFSLGTPNDIEIFLERSYAFLFDLDGTLINTNDIYYTVWREILIKYNIHLTKDIFDRYIQGNSDFSVINTLLDRIDVSLEEISTTKDNLFLKNISQMKIIPGSVDFLRSVYLSGYPLCIVTNCNKRVAQEIIKVIKIDKYIDFIITPSDCNNGKPSPEPYELAIKTYGIENHRCIIFEDSKSGIISGKSVNPKTLVGIQTKYSHNDLLQIGANISIKDFTDLTVESLLSSNNTEFELIKSSIIFSLRRAGIDAQNINLNSSKLKGGFIADIIEIDIYTPLEKIEAVFKYESCNITALSTMALKLELYEREYYFYSDISKHINIPTPRMIAIVTNDLGNSIGILLEKISTTNYYLNLDLNLEEIEVSLRIIADMAKMHSKFWGLPLSDIFPKAVKANGPLFNPFISNYVREGIEKFKEKWSFLISADLCDNIVNNFDQTVSDLFANNMTFIHGDIKSPNIFYDKMTKNPVFIDWQHCCIGKGVQDLVFFIIESFDLTNIRRVLPLFKRFYYQKLLDYNVNGYSFEQYESDFRLSITYIPFFTAVWFGNMEIDILIDKNFPYLFIQKLSTILDIS